MSGSSRRRIQSVPARTAPESRYHQQQQQQQQQRRAAAAPPADKNNNTRCTIDERQYPDSNTAIKGNIIFPGSAEEEGAMLHMQHSHGWRHRQASVGSSHAFSFAASVYEWPGSAGRRASSSSRLDGRLGVSLAWQPVCTAASIADVSAVTAFGAFSASPASQNMFGPRHQQSTNLCTTATASPHAECPAAPPPSSLSSSPPPRGWPRGSPEDEDASAPVEDNDAGRMQPVQPAEDSPRSRLQLSDGLAGTSLPPILSAAAAPRTSGTRLSSSLSISLPTSGSLPPATPYHSFASPAMPSDHPAMAAIGNRNSVFMRHSRTSHSLPRSSPLSLELPLPPARYDAESESASSSNVTTTNNTPTASTTDEESDTESEDRSADEELNYQLCMEQPFWHCYFMRDSLEFIWTSSPAIQLRPTTAKAPPFLPDCVQKSYRPPTPESVMSIVENLRMMHRNDICLAVVPFEQRLPELSDFIWRLFDGTQVDLWTALACLVLLRRYRGAQASTDDAPYEAPYSLFLGIFMMATTHCVCTDKPELLTLPSIARILDTWYEPRHLVKIRHETFEQLDYRCWISREDIIHHAENNLFDICHMNTSYQHYQSRQRQRMIVEERERRVVEERERLRARLERYMFRTPHDTLGSWNTKIMYCTETRFLFRHLPWFPGHVTPLDIIARSESAREYTGNNDTNYVYSPLLPAFRTRISSSTN
ncbi:hypothetical protein H4R20_001906 [Coemansia guatemalensis]|uniref:Uncharacterized protein n=1 Tax=Coemansia guatemalensis TaxID=2761395 RepID=A0A9W8I3H3_9FUNG|nr:hypothetical protein H4R20_001906 [Coemansia guatemalensis]